MVANLIGSVEYFVFSIIGSNLIDCDLFFGMRNLVLIYLTLNIIIWFYADLT